MATRGPLTGFKVSGGQDLGQRYVSKDYLLDAYVSIIPSRVVPGLWTWGLNSGGRLGLNDLVHRSSPVQVGTQYNWKQISNGSSYATAVKTDGSLWTWGINSNGVVGGWLGLNDLVHRSSPVQVGTSSWTSVAALWNVVVAIRTDGTLWSWGYGTAGQLGQLGNQLSSSPVQIGTDANWKQVSGGADHVAAIKNDGTLWAWGSNAAGQLGNNSTTLLGTGLSSPVQIGTDSNWLAVVCGNASTAALKTNGTLWTWGTNPNGQLGQNDRIDRSSPTQVGTSADWRQITITTYNMCGIKTNGTLWAWGDASIGGQNGLNERTARSSPVQVGSLTNWKQVECGGGFAMAIKTDGTLWAWGDNTSGQLGLIDQVHRSSPVQIGTDTNWKRIDIGVGGVSVSAIKDPLL